MNVHVLPLEDAHLHVATPSCWCHPLHDEEEDSIYIHRPFASYTPQPDIPLQ